jgi:tetratricopeptide (TPR) repeat protein
VSPALVLNDSVLVEWFRDQRSVPLLWRAHLSAIAQQPDATQLLDRYVAQMGAGRVSPQSAYLAGRLAQRLGRHAAAVELFSRMDSAILDVGNVDPGWGLLSLSYVLRARSLEALGMTDQARTSYRRFVHRWQDAESTPWLGEANAALARLDAPREIR